MEQTSVTIKGEHINLLVNKLRRKYGKKYCFTKGRLSIFITDVIFYRPRSIYSISGYLSINTVVRLVDDQTCHIKFIIGGNIEYSGYLFEMGNLKEKHLKAFLRKIKNLCKKNSWSCEGIDIFKATKINGRDILDVIILTIGLILIAGLVLGFLYAIIDAIRSIPKE